VGGYLFGGSGVQVFRGSGIEGIRVSSCQGTTAGIHLACSLMYREYGRAREVENKLQKVLDITTEWRRVIISDAVTHPTAPQGRGIRRLK